ncbi:30S ribosomal protein S12 methylthiotransferase RimO [uncultured Desulfobacter sp.]|uniref:30S ribosomal protein S12 methylthiotransferase RimO n=1 Tax=uncultured Desulfobacter sp. TaxID=240139 RepID=UPI002AAB562B|nr:30S ribosomal protein S12 methylthiotransferase RimO [uncultured Desulfobacter sp.]
MKIYLESLGCSRNLVDSEIMLGRLIAAGHQIITHPARAEAIIINTCGFISTASQEAVDVILEMAEFKTTGACQRLVVTGCLVQRYKDDPDLMDSLPEVDAFLGTAACDHIVNAVKNTGNVPFTMFPEPDSRSVNIPVQNRTLFYEKTAYIKVSEGCSRHCTYCIIPTLRGHQRSRPVELICKEASLLLDKGVKEIILTAENTTDYGLDLGGAAFHTVLEKTASKMRQKDPAAWLRFLYTHPGTLDERVIKAVQNHTSICSYYDVPIQHAHDEVLKRMGRPYTRQDLTRLFSDIRRLDPDAALRTTVIVGFPGETDEQFNDLLTFIQEVEFDHLGVFTYSDSQDLPSHKLSAHIPEELAELRHDTIMAAQAKISEKRNARHVGRVYPVLVEENPEEGVYIGRTPFQAPEVDGVTFIYSDGLDMGSLVQVKITDAFEYDIAGEMV